MPDLKNYALLALAFIVLILSLSTWEYRRMYKSEKAAHTTLQQSVEGQNESARLLLNDEKKRVESLRTALKDTADRAEKEKENFNAELERIRRLPPVAGPVRVQLVPGTCGPSGSGARPGPDSSAVGSPVAASPATGVLAPATVARVDGVIMEVEELQRDFNTCQALLPKK